MKHVAIVALLFAVGCSSPTAPTTPPVATVPPVVTPPVVTPPVVTTPPEVTPPSTPAPNPLLSDPRFDRTFYWKFALDWLESGTLHRLARQSQPPRIYLRTVHDNGSAIDALTLDQTAAALINTTGSLTGVFGLAGLERGTGTRRGTPGWITVSWKDDPERRYCGYASIAGEWIELYTNTPRCRCAGGPQVALSTVKHELGHALGFYHTDGLTDLMYPNIRECDQNPSEREIFHARVAYSMPIGSRDP